MNLRVAVLPVVALVFIFTPTISAQGLKCYQCNSETDQNCMSLFPTGSKQAINGTFLKECVLEIDGKKTFCRKSHYTIYGEKDYYYRVVRDCGWEIHKENKDRCYNVNTDSKKEVTCQCFSGECNTATGLSESPFFILVISISIFLHALKCI